MRNLPLKLVALLLVFVAATGTAAAQDPKSYPGVACMGSGTTNANILRSSLTGRAEADLPGLSTVTFFCPAVKDGVSISTASARVIDQRNDRLVSCTLRSGVPAGAGFSATRVTGVLASSALPVVLNFGALAGVATGYYWLTCAVPGRNAANARSAILAYYITELP